MKWTFDTPGVAIAIATLCLSVAGAGTAHGGPDSVVTFNEVHYHPAGEGEAEWIEIHNQMSVRVDLSGWSLDAGVRFTFPDGTIIEPGAFVVVSGGAGLPVGALGPFEGKLDNAGELILLRTRHGRMMDRLDYGRLAPWPAEPDGSGVSLAKRLPELGSERPDSWAPSLETGGTPGLANFLAPPMPSTRAVIAESAGWKYRGGDVPADWATPPFQDTSWATATGTFPPEVDSLFLRRSFAYIGETEKAVIVLNGTSSGQVDFYLNGELSATADPDGDGFVGTLIEGSGLQLGANILAAKVTVAGGDVEPVTFSLTATIVGGVLLPEPSSARPGPLVINEIQYHARPVYPDPGNNVSFQPDSTEWIEIVNVSGSTIDLEGWKIGGAVEFAFPETASLPAGEYVVVDNSQFSGSLSNQGERITLRDSDGTLIDDVLYFDSGRWPRYADGAGSTLELRNPLSDNAVAEAWAASDDSASSQWQTYTYRAGGREPPGSNNPDNWNEFLIGFLDAGEAWIDDISVLEDPDGSQIQLIRNGSFDDDVPGEHPSDWRLLGTHKLSRVEKDPEGGGNVLRIVATAETSHTYNNASTTTAGNRRIERDAEYEISFRARWIAGSPQLNTRLYLNRAAKTHILVQPETSGTPGKSNSQSVETAGPVFAHTVHTPPVPGAGEEVIVMTSARDPDGIGWMRVHYSVDRGTWESLPMAGDAAGRFLGILPGAPDGAVVQFYVEGADQSGNISTFPAQGAESRALYPVGAGRVPARLPRNRIRIVMLEDEANTMHIEHHAVSNFRWGTTVIYNDRDIYYDAGIRLRSAPFGRRGRPGWNIRFGDDAPFRGVHSTVVIDGALNVPRGDGTGWITTTAGASINEMLFQTVANRAGGVPASYDDIVYVNAPRSRENRIAQLKMMRFENPYLDEWTPNGSDGILHKQELVYYPSTTVNGRPDGLKGPYNQVKEIDIRNLGDDKEAYRYNYILRNNRARDDFSGIVAMSQAFSSSRSRFDEEAHKAIDVDNWMRVLALYALMGVADSYNNGLAHNLIFYTRPDDQKVTLFPWDLDHALYYPADSNIFGRGTHKVKTLIDFPGNKRLFAGHLLDFCQTAFNNDYLDPWSEHLHDVADQNYAQRFNRWIQERREYVLSEIDRLYPPVDFSVDATSPAETAEPFATINGEAWIDVRSITLRNLTDTEATDAAVRWVDRSHWELIVPVAPGGNAFRLEAFDFNGNSRGTAEVTITNTGTVEPSSKQNLTISELMYHPAPPSRDEIAAGYSDPSYFEFVELVNTGSRTVDLNGTAFVDGIDFVFPPIMLEPGKRIVVVSHATAFLTRYGGGIAIAGIYGRQLSNGGESIVLVDRAGRAIDAFTYADTLPWPPEADGAGWSLTRIESASPPEATDAFAWRPSRFEGGSPGNEDRILASDYPGDPLSYALVGTPSVALSEGAGPALRWFERIGADEAVVDFEVSSDLVNWKSVARPQIRFQAATILKPGHRQLTATLPADGNFVRIRVSPR